MGDLAISRSGLAAWPGLVAGVIVILNVKLLFDTIARLGTTLRVDAQPA